MQAHRRAVTFAALLSLAAAACGEDYVPPEDGQKPPPGAPVTPPVRGDASREGDIVALVNMARAAGADCGGRVMPPVPALSMDAHLQAAATAHAEDMAANNYFSHDSQDGTSFSQRIQRTDYAGRPGGENIAAGRGSAEATMQQWLESPGHCRNIMNAGFNEIGVGYASGGSYGHYWVQKFGVSR